jgi:integrase/recombinase XerD
VFGFIEARKVRHLSERTIEANLHHVFDFVNWAGERGVEMAEEVTRQLLEHYQRHLYHFKKPDGHPLSAKTQLSRLVAIRNYFKWMARQWHISVNPASELELPKLPKNLPRAGLTVEEVERILSLPNISDPVGLRDRAMMEVLYSNGIRRKELTDVKLYHVDLDGRTLFIENGKGGKDRVVPLGKRCVKWVDKYLRESRPRLCYGLDPGYLFLTVNGEALHRDTLSQTVVKYIKQAQITKPGACHLFRHTAATQMLEGGADVRYIQAMLGHSQLSTTELYTHVCIEKLKAVHEMSHPARWKKNGNESEECASRDNRSGNAAPPPD